MSTTLSANSSSTSTQNTWEVRGVANLDTDNETALTQARYTLSNYQVDVALKQAHVDLLISQLNRTQQQIDELKSLTTTNPVGELRAGAAVRDATYQEYVTGDMSVSAAELARDNAIAAVAAASTGNEGGLAETQRLNLATWNSAIQAVTDKDDAITAATTSGSLDSLRSDVESTKDLWDTANGALALLNTAVVDRTTELATAEEELADAQLQCQVTAYDLYREALEDALAQRAANLVIIQGVLEALPEEPAPGAIGSRCEKALSNGTYRPQRGEATCGEGNCCGAARVWIGSGTTANAAWRTIETCQTETTETYSYQPPRGPMELAMPTPESAVFACIEGAKTLAAAASAVATAVYMLA